MPDLPPILPRVAAAEPGATQECIDRYSGLVWSLARRWCATRELAEDAVQDVFISLWKSADRYDPAQGSEITFVAMIARRRIIDRVRRLSRRLDTASAPTEDLAAPPDPSLLERHDDVARALRALETLSQDQQRVIRLSVLQGLSHQQIAESLAMPLGTVKTHLRRGLLRVRESLVTATPRPKGVSS